ncbi:hypothetical protein B0H13DRAFT_2392593 [Mycena leptocephala]|nr:hypothetical protein B0H13DRAFT_2392593 [Mycena leptocephala]
MLLYNILYLVYTQELAIPLTQTGDVVSNLWAVCCAPELGRRSHSCAGAGYHSAHLYGRLPPPASGGFGVEFSHVAQAAASGGGRRTALAKTVGVNVMWERRDVLSTTRKGEENQEKARVKDEDEDDGWMSLARTGIDLRE